MKNYHRSLCILTASLLMMPAFADDGTAAGDHCSSASAGTGNPNQQHSHAPTLVGYGPQSIYAPGERKDIGTLRLRDLGPLVRAGKLQIAQNDKGLSVSFQVSGPFGNVSGVAIPQSSGFEVPSFRIDRIDEIDLNTLERLVRLGLASVKVAKDGITINVGSGSFHIPKRS